MTDAKKKTHHGGVPEEQPKDRQAAASEDATTGGEGGGPAVGYGANPHVEKPQTMPDKTRTSNHVEAPDAPEQQ